MATVTNGSFVFKDKNGNVGHIEGLSAGDVTALSQLIADSQTVGDNYVPAAGGAFEGGITVTAFKDTATSQSTALFDSANGRIQSFAVTADVTVQSNMSDGDTMFIQLVNGGAHTVTWPASWHWLSDDTPPTLKTSGVDVILVQQRGTSVYAISAADLYSEEGGGDDPSSPTTKFLNNITGSVTTTPSGRFIARHTSGKASVIQYNYHGTARVLVVADAQYRKRADTKWRTARTLVNGLFQFGTNFPTSVFNRANFYLYNQDVSGVATYVEGSTTNLSVNQYEDGKLGVITDDQMNVLMLPAYSNEDKSARECGDICISEGGLSAFPALEYCRSLTSIIDGGMDNPLMHDLCVLYVESATIDALDPTVSSYSDRRLGKGSNTYRWFLGNYCWSCQQYNAASAVDMSYAGGLDSFTKDYSYSVLPVREL